MSQDDDAIERVARAIWDVDAPEHRMEWDEETSAGKERYLCIARAALSAMPQRLSPELIAQLTALASRLTAQGEYEACDLIDTVVARVTAMPGRELLVEALSALSRIHSELDDYVTDNDGEVGVSVAIAFEVARAAADKIRAALEPQP